MSENAPNARKIIPYRDGWCWVCRDCGWTRGGRGTVRVTDIDKPSKCPKCGSLKVEVMGKWLPGREYRCWECYRRRKCGWTSRQHLTFKWVEDKDTDKPSKCPKCGSLNVERFRNKLMLGVRTVMDEKGSFSVEYPDLGTPQKWVLKNIGPSTVMFQNNLFPRHKILREKIVLSYSKLPLGIYDPWDNTIQGQIGQVFCDWLKKLFRQDIKNLKILSIEKITNPYNNVKGLEFLITSVWLNRPIRAKCLTFIKEQNRYDIIAMAEEREFRMTDLYFFLPVIQNFKF